MARLALSDVERATLRRLNARLLNDRRGGADAKGFDVLERYYNADQAIEHLGIAVPEEFRHFLVIASWCRTYVESVTQRQQVLGFRLPGESKADVDSWRWWQANDMDDEALLGRKDARIFGRSYVCVGSGASDDIPLVTVESPREMVHEYHPALRHTTVAARFYTDDREGKPRSRATLYQPNVTVHAVMGRRGWEEASDPELERDEHGLGVVPVEPLINGGRVGNRYGRSSMLPVMGLTDAAARALTNAQFATETLAAPTRWVAGMKKEDFIDKNTGQMLPAWEAYLGALMVTPNGDAKFGQFSAADLSNFERIVNLYGQLVAGVTGLPLRYFGQLTTNPPSADGIRADEARLVLEVEQMNLTDGASYERVARLVRQFQGKDDDPDLAQMETLWRDPATPTVAQTTDAAVKKFQTGIVSRRQALRDCGYTSVQIAQIEAELADEASDPLMERLAGVNGGDAGSGGGASAGAVAGNSVVGASGA